MSQVSDLSRSLVPFDQNTTLTVVVELSEASWLLAGLIPGVDRQPVKKQEPEPVALLRLLERWRVEAVSVAVSREHRRAKTDRLDTAMLMRVFLGWLRGERGHCRMVAIPTLGRQAFEP